MNHDDIMSRVSALETMVKQMAVEREHARREYREDMATLFSKIDKLQFDVSKNIPCPAPGLCLKIEKELADTNESVEVLEADRNRRIGERTIIGAVSGMIGAGVVLIINWISRTHN